MISSATGEVAFVDGLLISPHVPIVSMAVGTGCRRETLSVPGWTQHFLGVHTSDHGQFDVEVVTDPASRVMTVFLAHEHPFYEPETPEDAERRVYHAGVIAKDLRGQSEFSWGRVFCRFHEIDKVDWLVVAYTLGPHVLSAPPEILHYHHEHAPLP